MELRDLSRREQDPNRRRLMARLSALSLAEEQRGDRARANFSPWRGPSSGINNSYREYQEMLNRQGEIADLRSRLANKGPASVQHSYEGTNWAEGSGGRMPTSGLQALQQQIQPLSFNNRQRALEEEALRQARATTDVGEANAREAVFRDDPYRAKIRGDIGRAEAAREAEAESGRYFQPGQQYMREAEDRRQWEAFKRRYVDPEIVKAERERAKAYITSAGRVGAATATGQSRIGSAALNALARTMGIDPYGDPDMMARLQRGVDAIMPNVPGGGADQSLNVTQDEVAAFAQDYGISPEEAASYLKGQGYRIQ